MVVPCDAPVSTYPALFIVATELLLLLHVPPVDASLNVVPAPVHVVAIPVIAPGIWFTVTVIVAALPHPFA